MTHLPPAKKGKGAKACVMWAHPERMIMCTTNYNKRLTQYLVIPLGEVGELVERVARAFDRVDQKERSSLFHPWSGRTDPHKDWYLKRARSALMELGLPRARLGKGRK